MLGNDPLPTLHPNIQKAQDPFVPWDKLETELDTLKVLLNHNNVEVIISTLQQLVAGYQPSNEVVDWVYAEKMNTAQAANRHQGSLF